MGDCGWISSIRCARNRVLSHIAQVGCGKLQVVAQRGGCQNGSTRSTGCKKKLTFFKNDCAPHGMPKQVFLARFELVVAHLALLKSQNALKMGCFATKNGSKMRQKRIFPKLNLDPFGCTNK